MRYLKILVITIIVLLAPNAYAGTIFPDVSDNADYAEAVKLLGEMGVFTGDEHGNFNPNATITRAEFAAAMCRLLGLESVAIEIKTSSFLDVPASHWANGYIMTMFNYGIINGYSDGRFAPSEPVKYEQAVKMLVCACNLEESALSLGGYPDGYISVAKTYGITEKAEVLIGIDAKRSTIAILMINAYDAFLYK